MAAGQSVRIRACGGGQGRGHFAQNCPHPRAARAKAKASFVKSASPGPAPPHAALSFLLRPPGDTHPRTRHLGHFSRRRKVSVRMRTKGGVPVLPGRGRKVGASACSSRPRRRCPPSRARRCRRVVRLGANTLHGARAACPKRRVRRRTGTRPFRAKLPAPPRRPDKGKGGFAKSASPGPPPPHAASRTLFRTKKSVRSDAHYVGRTGLCLGSVVPKQEQRAAL